MVPNDYCYGDTVAVTSENGVTEAEVIDVNEANDSITLKLK